MEWAMFIITLISTIATVTSCIVAVRAKNQCQIYLKEIKNLTIGIDKSQHGNVKTGSVKVTNPGYNEGIIAGVISGEVNQDAGK